MPKSVLFSCFVATSLLFSSCNNAGEQSSDLELVSKNIDVATQRNQEASAMLTTEIQAFLVENTDIIPERKDKLQKTLDKISTLEKEEKKVIDLIDTRISEIEKSTPNEMDEIMKSASDFLKSINSNIENNNETEGVLNNIKSDLDLSGYKLDGTTKEKSLALKSIKLSVSHAHYMSVFQLKSMISLRP